MIELSLVAVSVLLAWVGLFVLTPKALRSISRHGFWRLRDELVDAMISENLSKSEAAFQMLRRIEVAIAHTNDLSILSLIAIPKPPRDLLESLYREEQIRLNELNAFENSKIQDFKDRFMRQLAIHVIIGSPLGWVMGATVIRKAEIAVMLHEGWHAARMAIGDRFENMAERLKDRVNAEFDRLQHRSSEPLETCAT